MTPAQQLRSALAELVSCKDLKEYIELARHASIYPSGTDVETLQAEYARRKGAAWAAARSLLAQPVEAEPPPCPNCDGSGETMFMTSHLGPDDYEFQDRCQHCGGTGALADAYAGVVGLLEAKEKDYMRVVSQLWGACHAREPIAWRWRETKGEGPWSFTDDREVLSKRPGWSETECLYPPLKWEELKAIAASPQPTQQPAQSGAVRFARMKAAIEGECDGLAIDDAHANSNP